jgi:hypothetical protein
LESPPGQPRVLDRIQGDCLEIRADIVMNGAAEVSVELRRAPDGRAGTSVKVNRASGSLLIGNTRAVIPRGAERYSLRLFLDKSVLEVFVNEGEAAVYTTFEAGPNDLGVALTAAEAPGRGGRAAGPAPGPGRGATPLGNARIESLTAWPMKPAAFSLEHFRT